MFKENIFEKFHVFFCEILNPFFLYKKDGVSSTEITVREWEQSTSAPSFNSKNSNVMFCAIWYHLYNLNNMKNTHGGC